MKNLGVVILAAGKGTRMGGDMPKVLLEIGGKTIIVRCLEVINKIEPSETFVVVRHKAADIKKTILNKCNNDIKFVYQRQLRGTADSLKSALNHISISVDTLLVLFGDDCSFFSPNTIKKFIKYHISNSNNATFLVSVLNSPNPIGGLELDKNGHVVGILRQSQIIAKNLSEYAVLVGGFCFNKDWIRRYIDEIEKSDLSGEYPLPYIYQVALKNGQFVDTYKLKNKNEWKGVNTPEELEAARLSVKDNK